MAKADWKTKYMDIRSKFLESTDVAYRLGYEEGMKDGAKQAEEQAMAEQQAAEQAAMGGGMPGEEGGMPPEMGGMPGEEGMEEGGAPMEEGGADDDMDAHISELEGLVAKGEKPSVTALRKAVTDLVTLRKSQKVKTPKQVESAQKKFVDSIINKFDKGTESVTEGLEEVISKHGLKVE